MATSLSPPGRRAVELKGSIQIPHPSTERLINDKALYWVKSSNCIHGDNMAGAVLSTSGVMSHGNIQGGEIGITPPEATQMNEALDQMSWAKVPQHELQLAPEGFWVVCLPERWGEGLKGAHSSLWTSLGPPESASHPSSCSPPSPLSPSFKFNNSQSPFAATAPPKPQIERHKSDGKGEMSGKQSGRYRRIEG
ncbi:hypothetical protein Q8A73_009800 [Channa argus]|nr:hypothetical protein Q8A73_009800 [Channa argus]